ncbi:MAG: RHS repeat-associated core domain-containing protein, partial [Microcystis panniformis]
LTRKVGNAENNYLFAGEQFDEAVDGYYLRARYYDPNTGRFASVDPFEGFNNQPITLHDYLYAGVNPVNAIDPSGEVAIIEYRPLLNYITPFLGDVGTLTDIGNAFDCPKDPKFPTQNDNLRALYGFSVPPVLAFLRASPILLGSSLSIPLILLFYSYYCPIIVDLYSSISSALSSGNQR